MAVNRKSRNADFVKNGSPKKKILSGVRYAPKKKKGTPKKKTSNFSRKKPIHISVYK